MATPNVRRRRRRHNKKFGMSAWILSGLVLIALIFVLWQTKFLPTPRSRSSSVHDNDKRSVSKPWKVLSKRLSTPKSHPVMVSVAFDDGPFAERNKLVAELQEALERVEPNACGYDRGLFDVDADELHPEADHRHMVTPPEGGKMSLVCCETTKGNLALIAHHKWAPIGAAHFVKLVTDGYFDTKVPMMGCVNGSVCEFGYSSDATMTEKFNQVLKDDPNWLPEGEDHGFNEYGISRYAPGYLAYAGHGPNTRENHFTISLNFTDALGGGNPWEVPWGELVGNFSYETLLNFDLVDDETGGLPPSILKKRGVDYEIKKAYQHVDYIKSCGLVDEQEI